MDPVEQTLVATQNLLCALEQDNSLLKDDHFMEKLTYLRAKHRKTTDFLLQKTQYPPRNHISGATYHKSPGCTHYWSELPTSYTQNTDHRDISKISDRIQQGQEEEFLERSPKGPSKGYVSRPIVQDAADVIRGLRKYRRTLRQDQRDSNRAVAEDSSSYQPRPSSFRPPRIRHFSSLNKSEKREEDRFDSQVVEEDDIPSREPGKMATMRKKSNSIQDLRPRAHASRQEERPSSSQVTVPKPFQFMQRKYKGNTYARKFLEKMLDEKEQEEKARLEEEERNIRPFKAHPVPATTYKSDNPRVEDQRYADAIRKKLQMNLKLQTTLVRSKSMGDVIFHQVKPVPASTYIAPDLYSYRRGRDTNKRAVQLLEEAHTPPGLKEHSVRTNVAFHLRHQHCRDNPADHKLRRQSVPDFRKLHREFNEKLQRVYSSKPPTVPVPFNLSENAKRHQHCNSASPPRFSNSRRPSPSYEPVFPVHETHSSLLRNEAIRKKLDKEDTERERTAHYHAEHEAEVGLQRSRLRRSISRGKEKNIEKKVQEKRQAMRETTRDYEDQLRDMKKRVMARPLVMEQQTTSAQLQAIERKFKQAFSEIPGVSRPAKTSNKMSSTDTKTLLVPLRRGSGATGDTFSVKSKKSSKNSSDKEEYKEDFESDEERPSRTSKSSGSSTSGNSSSSISSSRNRRSSKSTSST